jgi:hypothetical protein
MSMNYKSRLNKTFEVVGIPRSGQHAIVTWLMANLPSPSLFINNSTSIRPDEIWYRNGRRYTKALSVDPWVLGVGFEGTADAVDKTPNPSVFVVRDIKNHMASLIKHKTLHVDWAVFFKRWEAYADLAIRRPTKPYDYMVVPFSTWHVSEDTRVNLFGEFESMMSLRLYYDDGARRDVMGSGGGSSFDGNKYIGCADNMKVLERYKSVALPSIPSELLKMNAEIFGNLYE